MNSPHFPSKNSATIRHKSGKLLVLCFSLFILTAAAAPARVGLDRPSLETLDILVAIEKVKELGYDIRVHYIFAEKTVAESVSSGLVDIGMGTPYVQIQQEKLPLRMFFQVQKLRFYPVVNSNIYKTWADLQGATVHVHGATSGTEAIMNSMAKKYGISYAEVKYLPGSDRRMKALLNGVINATILDLERKNYILNNELDRFTLLPVPMFDASDEALYASTRFLENNKDLIKLLVTELLDVRQHIANDGTYLKRMRVKYNLMKNLTTEQINKIEPHFKDLLTESALAADGGNESSVKQDFEFYAIAGSLKGDPASFKVSDYWDFRPLQEVLKANNK